MSIADELITRGWTQGTFEDGQGRVCLAGAACKAHHVAMVAQLPAIVLAAVNRIVGDNWGSWNDAPGRTFDDVLRVAKEADELLEAS